MAPGHAAVRFTNPTTGGDVMPTIRAEMHRLRPGATTATRREVGSAVWQVFDGTGTVRVGEREWAVGRGDLVAVPSWVPLTINRERRARPVPLRRHPDLRTSARRPRGGALMKLTTLRTSDGTRAARVDGDTAVEIDAPDLGALLADPAWRTRAAAADGPRHELDFAPLVPRPGRSSVSG